MTDTATPKTEPSTESNLLRHLLVTLSTLRQELSSEHWEALFSVLGMDSHQELGEDSPVWQASQWSGVSISVVERHMLTCRRLIASIKPQLKLVPALEDLKAAFGLRKRTPEEKVEEIINRLTAEELNHLIRRVAIDGDGDEVV